MAQFTSVPLNGLSFHVPSRYDDLQFERLESSGIVCSARDRLMESTVAIKRLAEPFKTPELAFRTYQELKLAKSLKHENITELCDAFVSPADDAYLITRAEGMPLQRLLLSWPLEEECNSKMIFYQILRGLKYLHSANVIHCNLAPSSVIVDHKYDVRLTDFGCAQLKGTTITDFAATRYSAAPEVLLSQQVFDAGVDMWSSGCILAEMLSGRALFETEDSELGRICAITELLGKTDVLAHVDVLTRVGDMEFRRAIKGVSDEKQKLLSNRLSAVEPAAIDLLKHLLTFDPGARYLAHQALDHSYLAICHEPSDEPTSSNAWQAPDFNHEDLPASAWRNLVLSEILDHHNRVVTTAAQHVTMN